MTSEENQRQVEADPKAEQAEAVSPQPPEQEVEAPSDAEAEPQAEPSAEPAVEKAPPSERTFSQAEVSKIEGELQKQLSGVTTQLSQFRLQQQIAELERFENEAARDDKGLVDDGQITQAEADQRRDARTRQREQKVQDARDVQIAQGMRAEAEQYGRVLAARDFGKQYNLSEEQIAGLLSDKEIRTPEAMQAKAADLALETTQGKLKVAEATPQRFDQGLSGTRGAAEPETGKGKIKAGFEELHKTKK